MTQDERDQIEARARGKLLDLEERIEECKELTKPIPPSEAIGRVSRMDAINNRSVNEAALRQLERDKAMLLSALDRLHQDKYGKCVQCGSCLLYTSPSPRDLSTSRMPSSA